MAGNISLVRVESARMLGFDYQTLYSVSKRVSEGDCSFLPGKILILIFNYQLCKLPSYQILDRSHPAAFGMETSCSKRVE